MSDTFKGIVTADGKKRQLPYGSLLDLPSSDPSLTVEGGFADAAVVGKKNKKTDEAIASLKEDTIKQILSGMNWMMAGNVQYNSDGIPQEFDIEWSDGELGHVVKSQFNNDVLEYESIIATYQNKIITYSFSYDENGNVIRMNYVIN